MKRIRNFFKNAGKAAKKAFQVIVGAVALFFDYVVYALDCVLIAPFPRSTPSFRYWDKDVYDSNFKKYSYIRITRIVVVTSIILLLF